MNRTEKQEAVKNFAERVKKAKGCVLADYRGLTVAQLTDLRRRLKAEKAVINVVKNRLAKRAVKNASIEGLDEYFKGPTAVAISDTDPMTSVKILVQFARGNEKLKIKAGLMDGRVLTLSMIRELAALPSREILLARLFGTMNAPAVNIVGVLAAVPRQLVTVLNAMREKKGQ